jgi:hypothetical protein
MEPEAIPLQLALLTMEVAEQRKALARIAALFEEAARLLHPSSLPE